MQPDLIILVITGLVTALGTMGGVMLIIAKKFDNIPITNGQRKLDNGMQKQMDKTDESAKSLSSVFFDQVKDCNDRWMEQAEFRGEIKAYMTEIRDRLAKLEKDR